MRSHVRVKLTTSTLAAYSVDTSAECLIWGANCGILQKNLIWKYGRSRVFGFGMPELIIILVIVVVMFGAGRLPEIGGALGKSIRNFKKASEGKDEIEIKPRKDTDENKN